ncbi:hypothetical protein D3C76_1301380 [compost metagenome]
MPGISWYTGRPMEPSAWNTGALRTRVLMLANGVVTSWRGADQLAPRSAECIRLIELVAQPPIDTET